LATLITEKHLLFDRNQKPALVVDPGETVSFETCDPLCNQAHNIQEARHRMTNKIRGPQLTGPVYIKGAKPGDTLVVEVLKVEFPEPGFQLIGPDRAIIRDEIAEWTFYRVEVEEDRLQLPCGISLPVEPVIGTLGSAHAQGEPDDIAGPLGGNMDVPAVGVGSKVFIPVEVEGALFSLGDVHARQGDGEVVGAPEMPSLTTVRFQLETNGLYEQIMIINDGWMHLPDSRQTEAEAARSAVLKNATFISQTYGVELKDALILLTMLGRLSISRTGNWGKHWPVVASSFEIAAVEKALSEYKKQ
jgi:amidase